MKKLGLSTREARPDTRKDHVEGEAPAELEPLEAWSPMTL